MPIGIDWILSATINTANRSLILEYRQPLCWDDVELILRKGDFFEVLVQVVNYILQKLVLFIFWWFNIHIQIAQIN